MSVYGEAAIRRVLSKRCFESVRTPFFQNSNELLILIITISVVAKGVLANETVNYDTQAKTYVVI